MKRRVFITLIGGAAAAWPIASRAGTLKVGMIAAGSQSRSAPNVFHHLRQLRRTRPGGAAAAQQPHRFVRKADINFDASRHRVYEYTESQISSIQASGTRT